MKPLAPLLCLLVAVALAGCGPAEDGNSTAATTHTNHSSGNPLTAPADYLGAVSKGQRNSEATINLAAAQQAISLFNVTEGRYPKSIDELVSTGYLAKKPQMPSGQKLTYDPANGTLKVEPAN